MKPPRGMTIALGKSKDGRTIPAEVTITPDYCPCRWTCHSTPNPCSMSCLAHHPITTEEHNTAQKDASDADGATHWTAADTVTVDQDGMYLVTFRTGGYTTEEHT